MSDKLLVLDIDETLIHTRDLDKDWEYKFESDFTYDFKPLEDREYYTIKRPYLKEFLEYAYSNFKVGFWTVAGKDYAKAILENIGVTEYEFLYTDENCTPGIFDNGIEASQVSFKKLQKLRKRNYSMDNILVIDDTREVHAHNFGNLIHVPEFYARADINDEVLLKLIKYLEKIKDEPNYRKIEKRGWLNNI